MDLFSNSSECIVLIKNCWKACMHVFWGLGMSSNSTTIYRLSCMHANSPESIGTIIVFFLLLNFLCFACISSSKKGRKDWFCCFKKSCLLFFCTNERPQSKQFYSIIVLSTPVLRCHNVHYFDVFTFQTWTYQ